MSSTQPHGAQFLQQMPIRPAREHGDGTGIGDGAPHSGIDQDGASLRPQQEPTEMGAPGIRAWEHLRVALPMYRRQWHVGRAGLRAWGNPLDVRETYDLHVSYSNSALA